MCESKQTTYLIVETRRATTRDAPALADLLCQLGHPSTAGQVGERLVTLGDGAVLVAEFDQEVIGMAVVNFHRVLHRDGPIAHLTALVVDERFRGRGVGTVLLGEAESLAKKRKCELFFLLSNRDRSRAHRFYQACGLEDTHYSFRKDL
jgi:GNAT superfamily N-acetyltransferase